MDTDNTGILSLNEIREAMGNVEQVEEIFDKLDVAQDGGVNYSEFLMATIDK